MITASESINTTTWTFSLLLNAASSDTSAQSQVSCSLTVPLVQPAAPSGNSADRIGSFYGVPCGTGSGSSGLIDANGENRLGRISGGGGVRRFGGGGSGYGDGVGQGVGFEASLGYNQDADSAVMTVC